ncbi:Uncharacterised protein [Enterobacter cloacae]|nr:Uncharacterised protein [Enterobacter cloacae]
MPREEQANTRIIFKVMRFTTAKIGVEHQPFLVIMLEKNDALIRLTIFINRGNDHCRRVSQFRFAGLLQPAFKKHQRFGGKILAAQTAFGVFTAQMRNLL